MPIPEKQCLRCHAVKSITLFYRSKTTPDGRHSWCGACVRENVKRFHQERFDGSVKGRSEPKVFGHTKIAGRIRKWVK